MEREEIRRKIKADAVNLCTHIVNTACEYKNELLQLECDNEKLGRENMDLEKKNGNLLEQNNILMQELEKSQKRIRKLIKKFGINNCCYNCDHFLDCSSTLCVYCQKWVCACCVADCDAQKCSIDICTSCYRTHSLCPIHHPIPPSEDLITYYKENRFKKI